jgi:hypothetical protein
MILKLMIQKGCGQSIFARSLFTYCAMPISSINSKNACPEYPRGRGGVFSKVDWIT